MSNSARAKTRRRKRNTKAFKNKYLKQEEEQYRHNKVQAMARRDAIMSLPRRQFLSMLSQNPMGMAGIMSAEDLLKLRKK